MVPKNKVLGQTIFALLFPLFSLYTTLKSRSEKLIVFSGTLFMGVVGSVTIFAPGMDGAEHIERVRSHYMNMSVSEFFQTTWEILTLNSSVVSTDPYIHTLSYMAGSIFAIPDLIHVLAGLVLGYFYTKSVLLVLRSRPKGRKALLLLLFIAFFLVVRSITALNSIRMWTGMWVLFYGSYSWMLTRRSKYFWVMLLAPVVHFSYLIFSVPVILAYFFKKRRILLTVIYIASFSLTLSYFSLSKYMPKNQLLERKEQAYIESPGDSPKDKTQANTSIYVKAGPVFFREYVIVGLSFILLFFYFSPKVDEQLMFLIASGILLFAFSNMVGFSPSISGRARTVGSIFITAANLHLLCTLPRYKLPAGRRTIFNIALWIVLICSIPFILFHISYMMKMMSVFTFFAPIISWVLGDGDISIRDVIGDII